MATDITILDGIGDGAADGDNTFEGDVSATPGTILATDNAPTSIYESELEGIPAADIEPRPQRGQWNACACCGRRRKRSSAFEATARGSGFTL